LTASPGAAEDVKRKRARATTAIYFPPNDHRARNDHRNIPIDISYDAAALLNHVDVRWGALPATLKALTASPGAAAERGGVGFLMLF